MTYLCSLISYKSVLRWVFFFFLVAYKVRAISYNISGCFVLLNELQNTYDP